MIAGLKPIQETWQEALTCNEFSPPSVAFEARLIAGCDGSRPNTGLETSTGFALVIALQQIVTNGDLALANRLVEAITRNSDRIVDSVMNEGAEISRLPVEALISLAIAKALLKGAAPDRVMLTKLSQFVAAKFAPLKRSNPHAIVMFKLVAAAYAALVAQDLNSLRQLLSLRKTLAIFPKQWDLFHGVAKSASVVERNGVQYIRVDDPSVRDAFFSLFQAHRYPFMRQASEYLGEETWFGGPLIGSYIYSWIYLQSFAPEPVVQSDWGSLRELRIG